MAPHPPHLPNSADPGHPKTLHALVLRAQGGDTAAFTCLVEDHQASLVRFCARLVRDPTFAQDLAQETFVRAQHALPLLSDPERFGGWLHGIALNLARTWWRRQFREPLSLDHLTHGRTDDTSADAVDQQFVPALPDQLVILGPEDAVAEAELAAQVRQAIAALPPELGRTVALHYLDGYSCAEIAAALRVPISTVKTRLFKSRGRLRLVLAYQAPERRTRATPKSHRKGLPTMPTPTAPPSAQATPEPTPSAPAAATTPDTATRPKNIVHCSFCLTPHEQVERLIAGPGQVYICNRCVAKCNDILRREGVPA